MTLERRRVPELGDGKDAGAVKPLLHPRADAETSCAAFLFSSGAGHRGLGALGGGLSVLIASDERVYIAAKCRGIIVTNEGAPPSRRSTHVIGWSKQNQALDWAHKGMPPLRV